VRADGVVGLAEFQNAFVISQCVAAALDHNERDNCYLLDATKFKHHLIGMIVLDRITTTPDVMNGQPCLRGMRLTVRRVLEIAAVYPDRKERQIEFPELEDEDVKQALHYAALQLPDSVLTLDPDALVA
jgi:uncharacterized protein (DUF433 family)